MIDSNLIRTYNEDKENIDKRRKYLKELKQAHIKLLNETFNEREEEEYISKKFSDLDEEKKKICIEKWMEYRKEDKEHNEKIVRLCDEGINTCDGILRMWKGILDEKNEKTGNFFLKQIENFKKSLKEVEEEITEVLRNSSRSFEKLQELEILGVKIPRRKC